MAWSEARGGTGKKRYYAARYKDPQGVSQTVKGPDGRPVRYSSKRAAEHAGEEQEAKIRNGVWLDPRAGNITFAEYVETVWFPCKLAEKNTVATYRSHYNACLKERFGAMPLKKILRSHVAAWVKEMDDAGVPPGTIKARYKALQTILAAKQGVSAMGDELIDRNPCERVALPTVPEREVDIFDDDEIEVILAFLDPWYQPISVLAFETGCRWGELMGLQVNDFALGLHGYRQVTIRRTVVEVDGVFHRKPYPKGKRTRVLKLSPEVGAFMAWFVTSRMLGPEDRLFSKPDLGTRKNMRGLERVPEDAVPLRTEEWPDGMPISRSYHRETVWEPTLRKAGIPHRRFHDIRATNISQMLGDPDVDLPGVMERAGHSQAPTTFRYVKTLSDSQDRAVTAIRRHQGRTA